MTSSTLTTEYIILLNKNTIFPCPVDKAKLYSPFYRVYNKIPIKEKDLRSILLAHMHLKWNLTLVDNLM